MEKCKHERIMVKDLLDEVECDMQNKFKRENAVLKKQLDIEHTRVEEMNTIFHNIIIVLLGLAADRKIDTNSAWLLQRALESDLVPNFGGSKAVLLDWLQKTIDFEEE